MTEPQFLGILAISFAAAGVQLFWFDKAARRERKDFFRFLNAEHEEMKPVTNRPLRDVISAEARAVELEALRGFVAKVARTPTIDEMLMAMTAAQHESLGDLDKLRGDNVALDELVAEARALAP